MDANGGMCSIISAEGGILEIFAGRYSGGCENIDNALKAYSADPIRVDRMSGRRVTIPEPALTILLMLQPKMLADMIGNRGMNDRGLTGRFLYSIPKSRVGSRKIDPDPVPEEIRKTYEELVFSLLSDSIEDPTREEISLSEGASQLWQAFSKDLEPKLVEEYHDIQKWAGKIAGTTLRIAGLICRVNAGKDGLVCRDPWEELPHYEITEEDMRNAIRIARYFIEHAQAAFCRMGLEKLTSQARKVLEIIRRQKWSTFSLRDIQQQTHILRTADEIQSVLDHLQDYGYIQITDMETHRRPGRPSNPKYRANPVIFQGCLPPAA